MKVERNRDPSKYRVLLYVVIERMRHGIMEWRFPFEKASNAKVGSMFRKFNSLTITIKPREAVAFEVLLTTLWCTYD